MTVCGTGCTTISLQAALNSLANCGDTIQVKSTETQIGNFTITYRGCAANPITVTSDRAAWLPPPGARITPSHLANMAQIKTPNTNPALASALDGMMRPPAGWIFIGIAFGSTSTNGTFELVGFNGSGTAANSSQISDQITFDRCYWAMPTIQAGGGVLDAIRADATNLTVKNSFFGDSFYPGAVESHAIRVLTSSGPVAVMNTFIITAGIPIFTGGSVPSYPAYMENGLTAQYNYFWRPYKYNGDPAQPNAADYVAFASGQHRTGPHTISGVSNTGILTVPDSPPFEPSSLLTIAGVGGCTFANASNWRMTQLTSTTFQLLNFPGCNSAYTSGGHVDDYAIDVCTKNLGELKWGTGITWQYNVGENSWWANQCLSQYTGFTDTLRTNWDWNVTTPSIGTFSMGDATHITWSGTYRIPGPNGNIDIDDNALCLSLPTTGTECHKIASYSGASMVMSTAFSAAPGGSLNGWIVYTGSAKLEDVTYSHNVLKNVDEAFSVLGVSFANGVGDAGFGKTNTVSQNLSFVNTSYISGYKTISLVAAEADESWNPSGFNFDHNTIHSPYGFANGSFVYASGEGCGGGCATTIQPKFTSGAITNNLFAVSAAGGNGPFSGDGVNTIIDTVNAYFVSTNVKNNVLPGAVLGTNSVTGGNAVSGNILTWTDPFGGLASSGIFNVQSSSGYYHAGTDGASLGADFTQLPMVNNVQVIPVSSTGASLQFDLSAPIADVKNTQVCVLEVSANRNLLSDLGSYTVTADLDPTVTIGADLSTRSDVVVAGNHVTWPLKGLSSGFYFGRLMCYGDTEWFTFTVNGGTLTCDLNRDALFNVLDVQLMTDQVLGITACTNNLSETGSCNVIDVQRVINAALGFPCVIGQ